VNEHAAPRRALYTAIFQRPRGTTLYVADGKPVFSGLVYHASYLRFMERGRTNYLRLLGADQRALFEETEQEAPGFAFVVRSMQIEFRKAARMNDVLEVITTPHEVRGASITLDQCVMRGDDVLIEARVQVAFVSGGRARRIPEALRTAMRAVQKPAS
jgi:acyl-CoA thioester hydrolase